LDGVAEDDVERLIKEVASLRFAEVEPMIDEDHADKDILWLADVRVHTADSFAARVSAVEDFAARKGLAVGDYAAGLVALGM